MKVEIDTEWVDQLVVLAIENSIKNLKQEIKTMKAKFAKSKCVQDYEKADLADCILHIEHLKRTHEYYGGDPKNV